VFYDIRSEGIKMQVMVRTANFSSNHGSNSMTMLTRLTRSQCQAQEAIEGGVPFEKQHEPLRRGDIIGIIGYPGRTSPKSKIEKGEEGELSIFAREVILLTPCLHQLPDEYYGFKNQEERYMKKVIFAVYKIYINLLFLSRYRKRYLDLIMNEPTRNVFITRSRMITYIRKYLDEKSFVEVEVRSHVLIKIDDRC
jgi:lysyl-tRNA synthetase, class II